MNLPDKVKIVEVGPRDGLQNESRLVPVEIRVELIGRLAASGLKVIEAGSFVSPKWVPQMASSAEVFAALDKRESVSYPMLVPNMRGLESALEAGVKEIAVLPPPPRVSVRRTSTAHRTEYRALPAGDRRSIESEAARARLRLLRAGLSYEGDIDPAAVADVAAGLFELGCYEISLGDTIGTGTPLKTQQMILETAARPGPLPGCPFSRYLRTALANLLAALQMGSR